MANSNPLPPNAGKGRPKGSKNKLSGDVKAMILAALDEAGGQAYLLEQARKNPVAFLALLGKVLPTQVSGDMAVTYVFRTIRQGEPNVQGDAKQLGDVRALPN